MIFFNCIEPYATTSQCCIITQPNPLRESSRYTPKLMLPSGIVKTGADVNWCLSSWKTLSHSSIHVNRPFSMSNISKGRPSMKIPQQIVDNTHPSLRNFVLLWHVSPFRISTSILDRWTERLTWLKKATISSQNSHNNFGIQFLLTKSLKCGTYV